MRVKRTRTVKKGRRHGRGIEDGSTRKGEEGLSQRWNGGGPLEGPRLHKETLSRIRCSQTPYTYVLCETVPLGTNYKYQIKKGTFKSVSGPVSESFFGRVHHPRTGLPRVSSLHRSFRQSLLRPSFKGLILLPPTLVSRGGKRSHSACRTPFGISWRGREHHGLWRPESLVTGRHRPFLWLIWPFYYWPT